MAGAKKNNYLLEDPTRPFSMRFSKKHAAELVPLLIELAEEEDRSFPGAIERVLVKHFKLNRPKQHKP